MSIPMAFCGSPSLLTRPGGNGTGVRSAVTMDTSAARGTFGAFSGSGAGKRKPRFRSVAMTQGGVRTRTRAHLVVSRKGYWEAERCACVGRCEAGHVWTAHAQNHGCHHHRRRAARFLSAMTLSVRISAICLPRQSLGEALR